MTLSLLPKFLTLALCIPSPEDGREVGSFAPRGFLYLWLPSALCSASLVPGDVEELAACLKLCTCQSFLDHRQSSYSSKKGLYVVFSLTFTIIFTITIFLCWSDSQLWSPLGSLLQSLPIAPLPSTYQLCYPLVDELPYFTT